MTANSLVAAKRKPDGLDALKALPVESWLTMEQLFSRIPEVADLLRTYLKVNLLGLLLLTIKKVMVDTTVRRRPTLF